MSSESKTDKSQEMNKVAFVLGYTGETGKSLIKEMNRKKLFKKVVLIGRREVELEKDIGPEFEQRIVDFDNIAEHADKLKDIDTGFCCLGTTRGKAGKDGFIKVDHDYVVNSAEVAKKSGCRHFLLVTAGFSNKNSVFLYPRVKGEVEEEIKAMNFDRLSIFRPGVLLCDRVESRPVEHVFRNFYKILPNFMLRRGAISTDHLAKAMLNRTMNSTPEQIEIFENKDLYDLI